MGMKKEISPLINVFEYNNENLNNTETHANQCFRKTLKTFGQLQISKNISINIQNYHVLTLGSHNRKEFKLYTEII